MTEGMNLDSAQEQARKASDDAAYRAATGNPHTATEVWAELRKVDEEMDEINQESSAWKAKWVHREALLKELKLRGQW